MSSEHWGPGIPDEDFMREPGVPMTKNEIRVLSLARLRLFPGAVLYDIGAGTGSVAIEVKQLFPSCSVYAIERDPRALSLLKRNCDKFGVELFLVEGAAPADLAGLPAADRIFIGGSGGDLPAIIRQADDKLKPGGRMVLNSVTLHSGPEGWQTLEELGYSLDAMQANIAVTVRKGRAILWQARNPVTIISGQKGERA
ncbi:MAG TPA: precorrin-6Y C5,15-methyltransferase (decarboxylating) subunit CbiT [Syntrophomonadaceae bacterium]|nr:precorrin-6Y C5,15-methyltransferase (decarboxylating) subunit CbiT [Syntrophomonadaceae bacterium]